MSLIYLASPYSHDDPTVRQSRFEAVTAKAAELFRAGTLVFSPITHCHPIAAAHSLPTNIRFWESYCRRMLMHCDELYVLQLPGLGESAGVALEVNFALSISTPITYINP